MHEINSYHNSNNQVSSDACALPPRAPLTLRIGVTGHRSESDDLPTNQRKHSIPNITAIQIATNQILKVIVDSFKGVAEAHGELFDLTPTNYSQSSRGTLRIISALASGADQWVVNEALQFGFELQSILPFHRKEYLKDFTNPTDADTYQNLLKQATAVLELDGVPDSRSYEAVGRALLYQTDLIIAVWDGKASHGKGGTGQIVSEALQNGIPVVCIPWDSPKDWYLMEDRSIPTDSVEALSKSIEKLLLPPVEEALSNLEFSGNLRAEYFNEKQKRSNLLLGIWAVFTKLICCELFKKGDIQKMFHSFRVKDFESEEENNAQEFWNGTTFENPIDLQTQAWINERFNQHYAWANGLSFYYGNMHRSAFVLNYLLGATAVCLALVCVAFGISGIAQTGWIVTELVVILGILILTFWGQKKQWHQRWIDYRTLAERMRMSRNLILFGGGTPQVTYGGHLSKYGNPSQTWMNWHNRAIERAAGVPPLIINESFLSSCREIWSDGLIQSQINYHQVSFVRFEMMNRRLHHTGNLLFGLTLLACIIHLAHLWMEDLTVTAWLPENLSLWMTGLCAFLPALGAAFSAIRNQSEVQRLAQRSKAMEEALIVLKSELDIIPTNGDSLNSVNFRRTANRVNDLMTNEMLDWRVVFQDRPLGLPN